MKFPWSKLIPNARPGFGRFDLGHLRSRARTVNEDAIRRLSDNAYLGDNLSVCRALGRYKMFVDTDDVNFSSHLLLDGFWEMWITEALVRYVGRGMRVIDIGANLGFYTLLMADLVGPSGHVHAFEPTPRIVSRLNKSLQVNGFANWVKVHAAPVTDRADALVDLIVPASDPSHAAIGPVGSRQAGPGDQLFTLRTVTVDATIGDARIDFIKVDAEGAEFMIWRGMRGLIARNQPLVIFLEFAAVRYPDPAGFLKEIHLAGFSLGWAAYTGQVEKLTADEILAADPHREWMLVLARS